MASNASTIRGISPPPKPRLAEEMDVFDDLSSGAEPVKTEELREVVMDEEEVRLKVLVLTRS